MKDDSKREEVTIQETFVDFGACSKDRSPEPQIIHVTNHTEGKITCVWIVPLDAVTGYVLKVIIF
jgi:hypothetical protein